MFFLISLIFPYFPCQSLLGLCVALAEYWTSTASPKKDLVATWPQRGFVWLVSKELFEGPLKGSFKGLGGL